MYIGKLSYILIKIEKKNKEQCDHQYSTHCFSNALSITHFLYNEKEQNQQLSMKNNAYVIIDAHIIRCRLHHHNTLKYSVGLKSGKDASIATEYRPSKNLIIEMDTNLRLYADKYAYDNFPKLTLTVQAEGQGGERRTVGSTFVNFRKEGLQICQVSECSCKDKAFQIEISFTLKILEKISKPQANKNQPGKTTPGNFMSQQPTPRHSRETKLQLPIKPLKDYPISNSQSRLQKLNKVKSQTIILPISVEKESQQYSVRKEVEVLNNKITQQEDRLLQLKEFQRLFFQQKQISQELKQLLKLEEQKSREAGNYICSLEQALQNVMVKNYSKQQISSFKVIEEKDEILQMNQQLQGLLEKEKQKNLLLQMEIEQLREQINKANSKLLQVACEKQELIEEFSIIKIKNDVKEYETVNNQILIASVCKPKVEIDQFEQKRLVIQGLNTQILSLEQGLKNLKLEVEKYQEIKKNMQDQIGKMKSSPKKVVAKSQIPGVKREEQVLKSEKGNSRQKNVKQSPKIPKKSANIPVSNIQITPKKSLEVNSYTASSFKHGKPLKLASTQVESKTQQQESMQKSDDFLSQHVNSQKPCDQFNGAIYFTSGLQG